MPFLKKIQGHNCETVSSVNRKLVEWDMESYYNSTSGSVESNKPELRTNPNFEQTQSSNKSKLRTNPNFE